MLKNKVAVVTGAGSGLGFAISKAFLGQGAVVVGCGLEDGFDITHPNAHYVKANLTSPEETENVVKITLEKFGKLNIVVNSAGICNIRSLETATMEDFTKEFSVNAGGTFNMCKAAREALLESGNGSIINIASDLGERPIPERICYSPSKAAVIMLTKCMALELAPKVRVNYINPGLVETPMLTSRFKDQQEAETFRREMAKIYPLDRLGTTEDIANAAIFLASDMSRFTTGSKVDACGGSLI